MLLIETVFNEALVVSSHFIVTLKNHVAKSKSH